MFHDFQHERNVLVVLFRQFIRRTFDIRRGEERRVFLMFLYIFLVVSTLLIIKPVSNAKFLATFGASQLPYAFLLVSVFAAATVTLYTRQIRKTSYDQLIVRTLHFCIGSLALFWLFIAFDLALSLVLYLFYIWTAIFAVIVTSQFWILANVVFSPREARRLFGVIGAGAISGGIFGGYLTTLLAPAIGSSQLLLVCIAFLLICVKITRVVSADAGDRFHAIPATQAADSNPIRLLLSSQHLAYLAGIVGISVLVAKLVEFQFSAIAAAQIEDQDQLTAFFGFWLSTLNIVSLLVQLFLTARVVGRFGVGSSLLFLPAGILIGTMGVLIHPALWTAVALKIVDGSLKQSINKAGMELLALPIPNEIKRQAKSLIDVLVDSVATGVSGVLLLILTLSLSFSLRAISIVTIGLLAVWIYMVIRVRREYIESFRLKIDQGGLPSEAVINPESDSILDDIAQVLATGEVEQVSNGLSMIRDIRSDRLMPALESLLLHPTPSIQAEALRQLYYYRTSAQFEAIRGMVYSADPSIKTQAIHYIFQHSPDTRRELLNMYLGDEDYLLRGAALLCAAREGRSNDDYKEFFKIAERIAEKLRQLPQIADAEQRRFIKTNCALAIGAANIPELFTHLPALLADEDDEVARAAMLAMGQTRDPDFIAQILPYLVRRKYTRSASESLYLYGSEIIDLLALELADPQQDAELRACIPQVIAEFAVQKSASTLLRRLEEPNLRVRHAVIKALNQLRIAHPYLHFDEKPIVRRILQESQLYLQTLSALNLSFDSAPSGDQHADAALLQSARKTFKQMLEQRLDENLERIFRLIGLKYPPDDIYHAYLGIRSEREDLRQSAVEFLDNVLESSLKRAIIPIVETQMVSSLIDDAPHHFDAPQPTEIECLATILSGHDDELRAQALALIAELNDRRYDALIMSLLQHPDSKTRKMARIALTKQA